MSFSFRDKPRLRDRLRGKSSDEILDELKEQLDQDRKMFFDTNSSWGSTPMTGSFSRSGFPFEDEMMSRGRQDIRSHLDDLAQRHPEFADHLRCPPWGGELGGARTWGRKRRGSGSGDDDARSQASGASSSSNEPAAPDGADNREQNEDLGPLRGRSRQGNLPQYGLRNTVDLGQQQHESEQETQGRGQRSMSAPPDNRSQHPQRYVSRIEINPVNPADPTSGGGPGTVTSESHGKPPVAPKQQQANPTKQPHAGNVRHIPIFVEGRDEPILPKNVAADNTARPGVEQHGFARPPPHFATPHQFYPQQQQAPPQGGGRNFQQHQQPPSPKQQRQTQPQQQQQQPPPPQQQEQQPPPPQQQEQQPPSQQQQQQPPKPPEAPAANDPISRVQAVQKVVESLHDQVNNYSGSSRHDKDYMLLDEMLTRNLLKLDDIETEGKDNVRQARKDAIRTIQRCISLLEGKVPVTEEKKVSTGDVTMEAGECQSAEPGESATVEAAPVMEVAQSGSVTEQSGADKPSEDQQMEVSPSTEVKTDETDAVPMEVEEQKQSSETQPVAKAVELKKTRKGGKKGAAIKKDSKSDKVDQPTGGNKVPETNSVTENSDSNVVSAEVPSAPQSEVENRS